MKVRILKYFFFSIIIIFFEYAKNELYFVNDRGMYLERNVINFRNSRILADADNQFDLNEFYESTLSLASQLGDFVEGNKEITHLRNIIDSHIKKHKENATLPNLNNLDKRTKKIIYKLQKELEEVKKELDNKSNSEIITKVIQDKIITKTDENNYVSEYEYFKQLKNVRKIDKLYKGLKVRAMLMFFLSLVILLSGSFNVAFVIMSLLLSVETFVRSYQYIKLLFKVYKIPRKLKTSK
ncbi:fam-b protein [Plasmodium berghei]|uniref:Fam-b protein n=2 Tax=Plasmodium berghei TaxID=5821 RepID=A0A509ALF1_PLABA|nr:fam-b protein [Plasmodium berghei ANKA]CXI57250.1 fam-b protein [Plasmodium berghei]SCL95515.1 fam-b protein [Plasmodium berghei]SCM16278.1 fam-b protein [Plasmodium berghei]SCM18074.1 fam-b protein [Plasmodium berghei]VUC56401.1 fam-b protein [Plasmodium berghei ANKA]|eukprot:XP_034422202.1 fam-b protein [Plasmodium berghei ANKA]